MDSEKSGKEKSKTKGAQIPAEQSGGKTKPQLPPATRLPQAEPSLYGDETSKKKSEEWREKIRLVIEVIGLLVLIAYTTFAALQWSANRKAADAAASAAATAANTLIQAKQSANYDLRPYLSVTKLDMLGELKEGQKIKGHAEIVNSGRSPAVSVEGCSDVALLPSNSPMTDDFPCPAPDNPKRLERGEFSKFTLGSGAPFPLYSPGTTINITPVGRLIPLLTSGAFRIYFYGNLTYKDILDPNVTHHTTFCGRYDVESRSLDICEKHNEMD